MTTGSRAEREKKRKEENAGAKSPPDPTHGGALCGTAREAFDTNHPPFGRKRIGGGSGGIGGRPFAARHGESGHAGDRTHSSTTTPTTTIDVCSDSTRTDQGKGRAYLATAVLLGLKGLLCPAEGVHLRRWDITKRGVDRVGGKVQVTPKGEGGPRW